MKLTRIFAILALIAVPVSCASVDDGGSNATEGPGVSSTDAELVARPWLLTCRSTQECPAGTTCTTEDGVCNPPPGCKPGDICPAVCYGTCKISVSAPTTCGGNVCAKGTFCCNASCGTCAPIGGACTQQVCESAL